MKIWIVSCFLVAILLAPFTHAQGRGSRRYDSSQVVPVPRDSEESSRNSETINLSRDHRFDTRGLRRSHVPLEPQQLSLKSHVSTGQRFQSSPPPDVNRRNNRNHIRISQIQSESLNQNTNANDFSNSATVNRRNNFKENYSSSRLGYEHESLNAKATEIFERRSPTRSKPSRRDNFPSRTTLNEHETLSTRESEITERRSSRRGKSSVSYIEVSTTFPSRKHSSVTEVPDISQSRTRPSKTTTDSTRYTQLNTNEKLEAPSSLLSHRSFAEFTTFPTTSTSQISEEISVTKESFKSNPRSRNLNSENTSRNAPSRSKSRISNSNVASDTKTTLERHRNIEARTSKAVEGRQDSVKSRNPEVRGNTRARITEVETVPSSRNKEIEDVSRFENVDKKRGNSRIVNEKDSRSTFKSRNSDFSHIEASFINENAQKARSGNQRGQTRSKETTNPRHGSRVSNDGTTEGFRSRSEDFSKVRSRNENTSRGSFRSRNEESNKENEKYKTDLVKVRTRNRGSLNQNNGKYDGIQNLEPHNSNRHRSDEILLPQEEYVTEKNQVKTEINLLDDSNLPSSTLKSSEDASLVAEMKNVALDTQSELPVDVPSSSIGYEVQESTEPILLELTSSTTSKTIPKDETKNKDYINSSPENDKNNERIRTNNNKSQLSRSRSRKDDARMSDEAFVNVEDKDLIRKREKENKRSRLRSNKDSIDISSTTIRSNRGRNLRLDSQPVSGNSKRRKVSEKSTINTRNSPGPRGRIRVPEEEDSQILGRDSIESRTNSRKKDLTTDQTEVITRSRLNSKINIEKLSESNKKDIETSNSALRSIRLQGVHEDRNRKVNEYKEISTKQTDENVLHARRLSLQNNVKDDSTKKNEPITNRGRGRLKHTADGVAASQKKTSIGKKTKDKDLEDDVDEDANYPLEYIQLKKAGKGTKDILALLMARKKQNQANLKLRENNDPVTTIISESTFLPRSLPTVQKRIPLDLKTEEDQVQPSIESPIISRLLPSRQPPNRDLDPTLADLSTSALPETIQPASSQQPSLSYMKSEPIVGKEESERPTEIKRENEQIDGKNSNDNISIKSTRRKSGGKYSAQYRSPHKLGESLESSTARSFKPNRNSSIARNPGRSQNELIIRNTDKKESEKFSSVTSRFVPSAKTTNVPEIDKTELASPIKPRYQLYMAKDRKKLLDRRLGGGKDGNPTGFAEDLSDAKGNDESNTEKDGRWKRLKFGAASRPPYNPPRKSTSQLPKYTTTTFKPVSRFKSRKSSLLKRGGEYEEIAFEASEDEHDPITVEYFDRIDLFSTQPPKLESANLLSEIVSTTVSNLESSLTPSQSPSESPLLNTVFDGEPTEQVTVKITSPKPTSTITMVETIRVTTEPLAIPTTVQSTTGSATTSEKQVNARTLSSTNSVGALPITTTNKYFDAPTTTSIANPKNPVTETLLASQSTTTTRTVTPTTTKSKKTSPPTITTRITIPAITTARTLAPPTSTTTTTTKTITPKTTTAIKARTTNTITTSRPSTTQTATTAMNRATPSPTKVAPTISTIITTTEAKTTTLAATTTSAAATTLAATTITTVKTPKTSTKSVTKSNINPTNIVTRKISTTNKPSKVSTTKSKTVKITPAPIQPIPKQKPTTEKTKLSKTINKKNIFTTTKKPKQEIISNNPQTTISTTKMTTEKSSTTIRPETIITSPVNKLPATSNSETLLSRSYSIDEIPSETIPRPTRTPDPIPLSSYPTEPTLDLSSGDYVVYGLLPNKTLVRRVPSRTTTPPSELPFVVYGLYPNGTIVKRFPNGTVIPDDPPPQEANELVANVDPFNKQELSDIVERDRPLAYLYPTYSTITTTAPTTQKITTTNISTTVKTKAETTVESTTITTTKKPTTTQTHTSTESVSKKPVTTPKPSNKNPVTSPKTTTKKSVTTPKPTTKKPVTTPKPTTKKPVTTPKPTTKKPVTTPKPTTKNPVTTPKPTTKKPVTTPKPTTKKSVTTSKPTTKKPVTPKPTTETPLATTTNIPTTVKITSKPMTTTTKPIFTVVHPTTLKPTITTPTTIKPITNIAKTTAQNSFLSTTPGPTTIRNPEIKSTTDSQSRLAEDFALLNTLLKIQNEQSGNSIAPPYSTPEPSIDDDDLANRIIQLAIERAQASTESPTSSNALDTATPVSEVESSSPTAPLGVKTSSSGGKISLWVVPNEETSSPKSPELTPQEEQVLNALLKSQRGSTPPSIQDQILLAELLGGQSTTKRPRKKKKKPRASTTPRPPPLTGLAALISGLGSGNQAQGGGFFGSNTPTTGEGGSLSDDRSRNPGILVTAAINITKAVSQFMGIILQGAAQSFQNFVQSRTRAFSDYLTYNGSNGG